MDFSIVVGFFVILGILFETIGIGASSKLFLSNEALIIVFGGLLASSFVMFPFRELRTMPARIRIMFRSKSRNYRADILLLLQLSHKIHSQGKASLEQDMDTIKDNFMKHAVNLIVADYPPADMKHMLKEMIETSENRHEQGIFYFEQLAKYAPGFALVGTLIGLVKLLAAISDPKSLGPNMATALVSTFYGVSLANLVFLPMAGRLRMLSYQERIHKEILIECLVAIASGELPYVVREKVYMLVTEADRKFLRSKEKA